MDKYDLEFLFPDKYKKIKSVLKKEIIIDSSIYDLMNYYYNKKGKYLSKGKRNAVLELAKLKDQRNKLEVDEWIKSGVIQLACLKAIKKNKAYLKGHNEQKEFIGNISDVLDYAYQIVIKASSKDMMEELRRFVNDK